MIFSKPLIISTVQKQYPSAERVNCDLNLKRLVIFNKTGEQIKPLNDSRYIEQIKQAFSMNRLDLIEIDLVNKQIRLIGDKIKTL